VKRCAIPFLAFLVLSPAAASAKGVQSATICGSSGCHRAMNSDVDRALGSGATPTAPPANGAPWYRMRTFMGAGHQRVLMRYAVVPSLRLVRGCCSPGGGVYWLRMKPAAKRAYARLTEVLEPLPAATLGGVAPATAGVKSGPGAAAVERALLTIVRVI
jgi:hypothetical protein